VPDQPGLDALQGALGVLGAKWSLAVLSKLTEGTQRFNEDQEAPDAVPPVFEYPRSGGNCSVTGGYVIRDRALPSLYGRYLYGDFCAGALRSFIAAPSAPAEDDAELGLDVPQLSSFGVDAAGHYYAVSLGGAVDRLVPSGG